MQQKDFAAELNIDSKKISNMMSPNRKIPLEVALKISKMKTPNNKYFRSEWILTGEGDPFEELPSEFKALAESLRLNPQIAREIIQACVHDPLAMGYAAGAVLGNQQARAKFLKLTAPD